MLRFKKNPPSNLGFNFGGFEFRRQVTRALPLFPSRALAALASSFVQMRSRNRFLMEVLGDEIFRRRAEIGKIFTLSIQISWDAVSPS